MIKLVSPVLGFRLTWLLGNLKYIVRGVFLLDCAGVNSGKLFSECDCTRNTAVPYAGCLSGTVSLFKLFKKCFSTDYKSSFCPLKEKKNN